MLWGFSIFYQFRLITCTMSSLLFTHSLIDLVPDDSFTLVWVLFAWSMAACIQGMAAGLIFLSFAYYLQVAGSRKQLFTFIDKNDSYHYGGDETTRRNHDINETIEETMLQQYNTFEEFNQCEKNGGYVPTTVPEEDSPPETIDLESRVSTIEHPLQKQPVVATRQNAGLEGIEDLSVKVEALEIVNMIE